MFDHLFEFFSFSSFLIDNYIFILIKLLVHLRSYGWNEFVIFPETLLNDFSIGIDKFSITVSLAVFEPANIIISICENYSAKSVEVTFTKLSFLQLIIVKYDPSNTIGDIVLNLARIYKVCALFIFNNWNSFSLTIFEHNLFEVIWWLLLIFTNMQLFLGNQFLNINGTQLLPFREGTWMYSNFIWATWNCLKVPLEHRNALFVCWAQSVLVVVIWGVSGVILRVWLTTFHYHWGSSGGAEAVIDLVTIDLSCSCRYGVGHNNFLNWWASWWFL